MTPWRVLATVSAIIIFGIVSIWAYVLTGNEALLVMAGGAGGALFSYLGRINGNAQNRSGG